VSTCVTAATSSCRGQGSRQHVQRARDRVRMSGSGLANPQ
jgi:hypothetical protein